ncbi:hypothetical protein ACW5R3_07205 [Bizionia sp. KMM 8389]
MKYLNVFILLIVTICFSACDGRDRLQKSPQDILKETKLLDSFSTNTQFIPETYTEVDIDTLLSNGYYIKTKIFSDMNNTVIDSVKTDSITQKTHHREFLCNLIVYKNDKEIVNKTINKSFFTQYFNDDTISLKKMILQAVNVNQSSEFVDDDTNNASIIFSYADINNKEQKQQYLLQIQLNGELKVSHLEN